VIAERTAGPPRPGDSYQGTEYVSFDGVMPQAGDEVEIVRSGQVVMRAAYPGAPVVESGACKGSVLVTGRLAPPPYSVSEDRIGHNLGPDWPYRLALSGGRFTQTVAGEPRAIVVMQFGGEGGNAVSLTALHRIAPACPGQAPIPRSRACRARSCALPLSCPAGAGACAATVSGRPRSLLRRARATIAPTRRRSVPIRLTRSGERRLQRRGALRLPVTVELRRGGRLEQVHRVVVRLR
jgi:hypothetical protein